MALVSLPNTLTNGSTADATQVMADLNALLTGINDVDLANLTNTLAALIGLNVAAGPQMRGYKPIATSQTTTSTTFTTLATPDTIPSLVVPAGALVAVWYTATWQESIAGTARAAIFTGSSQLKVVDASNVADVEQAATATTFLPNKALSLQSHALDLVTTFSSGSYPGDVTTGQAVGLLGESVYLSTGDSAGSQTDPNRYVPFGGPCWIDNLPAGTYDLSVKFKTTDSTSTITASNRRLRAAVIPFG